MYRCEAQNANPAPMIQWIVNGILSTNGVTTQTHPPPPRPSGYVTSQHPTGIKVLFYLIKNGFGGKFWIFGRDFQFCFLFNYKGGNFEIFHFDDFSKIFWLSMLIFAGWRVTSDFSLKVLEEDTRIAITCNAISQGHFGDTMMKKAELTLTVLSKWMNTLQTRQGLWKTSVNLP